MMEVPIDVHPPLVLKPGSRIAFHEGGGAAVVIGAGGGDRRARGIVDDVMVSGSGFDRVVVCDERGPVVDSRPLTAKPRLLVQAIRGAFGGAR